MRILAIDTSLEACAVAVAADGEPSVILSETIGRGHAERLFPLLDNALAAAGLTLDAIDRFVVTTGPGSFTGIRVGVAAVRGLALATGKPALGISTLAVHAEAARSLVGAKAVLAVLPAKGDELFGQLFDGSGTSLSEPEVASAGYFAGMAESAGAVLAGAGSAAIRSVVVLDIAHDQSAPDIRALVGLARRWTGELSPPKPLYIKSPDAVVSARFAVQRR